MSLLPTISYHLPVPNEVTTPSITNQRPSFVAAALQGITSAVSPKFSEVARSNYVTTVGRLEG